MIRFIKRLFSIRKKDRFSVRDNISFEKAFEFTQPDKMVVIDRIISELGTLRKGDNKITIENPLKGKKPAKYLDIQDVAHDMFKDLEQNYNESVSEFSDEPIGFVYYLGTQLLFSNSVEIVQRVYHQEKDDIGSIFHSLVVKFSGGQYYYWRW